MQAASDKTFHLKWNNHLQNLSQLFTAIYTSSALADVTLACRDGTLRAHKLVLSACSPYFEQIFKDNPCKHPVVILKGIPFLEINLLVEFMYKGSVDVQEMDLQSLMHTASELEIRGLAYEVRANAAQLLNVNLEYPAYTPPAVSVASSSYDATSQGGTRTDMERLKQIHLYQQSMLREAERRKRREEATPTNTTNTTAAVNSILAAAYKELTDGSQEQATSCVRTEEGEQVVKTEMLHVEEETFSRPAKKRVSIFTPEEEKMRRKRMQYEVKQSPQHDGADGGINKLRISAVMGSGADAEGDASGSGGGGGGIKLVQLSALQQTGAPDHRSDDEEYNSSVQQERSQQSMSLADDEESCSSDTESEVNDAMRETRPHVCDICDIRFMRANHLNRHRLTHTGERPFTCGGCGKSFARSDKLRVHTKICERDDPTVDMAEEPVRTETASEVTSGMVRITHRDSRQLMFTPSGDVMLAPRAASAAHSAAGAPGASTGATPPGGASHDAAAGDTPAKRGRGRPKKPVSDVPKIKKRRGRPPKVLMEMDRMMRLGNGGVPAGLAAGATGVHYAYDAVAAATLAAMSRAGGGAAGGGGGGGGTVPMQQHITPSGQQLIVKRKRGRPPKNYFQPRQGPHLPENYFDGAYARPYKPYGRPKENYNATNLPFGDFTYLTEMMSYPGVAYTPHGFHSVTAVDPEQEMDMDSSAAAAERREPPTPIHLSSSEEDDEQDGDDTVPAAVCETEIVTVGDCQLLKLPASERAQPLERPPEHAATSAATATVAAAADPDDISITPVAPPADADVDS